MELTAEFLAQRLNGQVKGDLNAKVKGITRIETGKPGYMCFFANPKYEHYLYNNKASIILINKNFVPKGNISSTLILVDNAYESVAAALGIFAEAKASLKSGRSWRASVSRKAKLGKKVYVGEFAVIEAGSNIGDGTQIYPQVYIGNDVTIGKNCTIYAGVKIYSGCKIGDNCTIHANAVIGSDGFGFAPTPDGSYKKIPQTGIVTIEDDVEIGANTVIDRSTMETTLIQKGVKLDNLIQVAHNVVIGENTVVAAQAGIAGSAKVGKNCQVGGQVGISGHLTIADGSKLAAQSGVTNSIKKPNSVVMGSPSFSFHDFLRSYALFKKLPELWKNNTQ